MRIEVLGDATFSQQARTYAEYRVFAALTQLAGTEQVQDARVVLRRGNGIGDCDTVTCTITVTVVGSDPVRVRTTADHSYAAINRAATRLTIAGTSERTGWGGAESG